MMVVTFRDVSKFGGVNPAIVSCGKGLNWQGFKHCTSTVCSLQGKLVKTKSQVKRLPKCHVGLSGMRQILLSKKKLCWC